MRLAPILLYLAAPVPVLANPPLSEQAEISEGLIAAAIAWEIGERCGPIDARIVRGVAFLNSLRDRARDLGYSDPEIDAYIDDRAEKRRLEEIARARLTALGGVEGEAESFCAVGRSEIAAGSQIGQLLR